MKTPNPDRIIAAMKAIMEARYEAKITLSVTPRQECLISESKIA